MRGSKLGRRPELRRCLGEPILIAQESTEVMACLEVGGPSANRFSISAFGEIGLSPSLVSGR
jgi:hypothetical protein